MDRDLRIRLLLEAGDRVSRPLRDIANGGSRTAQALKATRDRLKEIEAAQKDIGSFRQLKTGLRTTEQAMQAAQTRVGRLAREIAQSAAPTRAMTRELAQARQEAQRLTRQQENEARQLQQLRDNLRAAGVSTTDLARHERELRTAAAGTNRELEEQTRRLAQAEDRQRRMGAARATFARTQGMATGLAAGGAAAIGTGVTMGRGIWEGVKAAQEYESAMTDIAQKADLPRAKAVQLGKELLVAAKAANQLPAAMQAGVDGLAGLGATVPNAVAMMTPIGRAATAYKAEVADLSAAAFAATDNLKVPVAQTGKLIDIMATAGKAGAFEIKDMAQYFPSLTAAYQGLGQTGTRSVADLAAGLQIARKGAGDAASAGTNLANVLQKIASPATNRAFAKMGVNLPAALKKAYAEGKTPLEAIAELTNKTLKGDLSKLGYLFEDAQVQQGLRPLIQNMELFRQIRAQAMAGGGTTDRDFAERMNDSTERTKQLTINAQVLGVSLGSVLMPTINAVTAKAAGWASWLADLTQRHPLLAKVVGIGAMALAGLFVVLGGGAIVMAGVMMPIAMINAGLVAMGVSGGLASVGLLPIIGTVAAVAAGAALFAGAAYLVYQNWGAIAGFFSSLWAGVKSVFSMSLLDILKGVASFVGFALGTLYRFGPAAYAWLTGTLPGLLVSGWTMAWGAFKGVLRAAFVTLPTMFFDFGAMIIKGLWNGIKSAPSRLWNAGKQLFSSLAGGFKAGAQIRSPSRVFMALGGHVVGGLNLGLDRGHDGAVGRMKRLVGNMAAAAALPAITTGAIVAPTIATAESFVARGSGIRINDGKPAIQSAATPGAAPAPGRVAATMLAPAGPIEIHIHPPAGANPVDIARAVRAEWEKIQREGARARGSTMTDPPDWTA